MYEILAMPDREVAANRSRCGVLRIRRPHETAHDLPRVAGTFHDGHQRRTLRDEFDELVVVVLAKVFRVMALGGGAVDRSQLRRHDSKLFDFESTEYLADEATRHAIGFDNEERSIHDEAI